MSVARVCEACRNAPIETTIESEEPEHPYRLCHQCAYRLHSLSLRPLEWFHLASAHGPDQFYLHDDFYDNDGSALQPEVAVVSPELYPAPTLKSASNDLEQLLDYAMTRYFLEDEVVHALMLHDQSQLLHSLQDRLSRPCPEYHKSHIHEICATVLRSIAAPLIRVQWNNYDPSTLFTLAEASAACLPPEEGFDLVVQALEKMSPREVREKCAALAWFRSEKTLDWLELYVFSPVVEDWGRLAALSHLSWERVATWLDKGRPLSLVAVDALIACWNYNTRLLERYSPQLLHPASVEVMTARLESYAKRDPVPRVKQKVQRIINYWKANEDLSP